VLESTRSILIGPLSISSVLLRLIAGLVAAEAVVKLASLVVEDDEHAIRQAEPDLLEVERLERPCVCNSLRSHAGERA
jgi:hypothetical protein